MGLKKYLETIRIRLFGPPEDPKRSGFTLSSNAPESDFSPRPQPVETSITIDAERDGEPRHQRPPGDGWTWKGGAWTRLVKGGQGAEMLEDDEPPRRGRKYRVNNPLDDRHDRR